MNTATRINDPYATHERDVIVERVIKPMPPRLRWGAILAGTVAALGLWILLYALGAALGLSAVDPGDDGSVDTAGTVTGIWGFVAPLVALFVGGLVAARVAGPATRGSGMLHGLVLWGLTAVGGVVAVASVASMVVAGAADVSKAAVREVAEGAYQLDATDALGPVNAKLREQGKPVITADQARAATQDVVRDAVANGRVDRELVISALAQNTNLTRAESEDVASRIQAQYVRMSERAKLRAQEAADATGEVFLGLFAALAAGLIAAMAGGLVGVTIEQRVRAEIGTPIVTREPLVVPR